MLLAGSSFGVWRLKLADVFGLRTLGATPRRRLLTYSRSLYSTISQRTLHRKIAGVFMAAGQSNPCCAKTSVLAGWNLTFFLLLDPAVFQQPPSRTLLNLISKTSVISREKHVCSVMDE